MYTRTPFSDKLENFIIDLNGLNTCSTDTNRDVKECDQD